MITARQMTYEILWMARRYADGRSTFAPSTVNEIIDQLIKDGIKIDKDTTLRDPEGLYASDGMFGFWRDGRFVKQ